MVTMDTDVADNTLTPGDLSIGLSLSESRYDAASSLRNARQDGFDFVTTATGVSSPPRSDVLDLRAQLWRTNVVGMIDDPVRMDGLDFCRHMQLPAVILPELTMDIENSLHPYAASVLTTATSAFPIQFWVPVPLSRKGLERWQFFRRLTGHHYRVSIMLMIQPPPTEDVTPADYLAQQLQLLHIFMGEQLAAVAYHTSVFLTNKKGYPTLSKAHQMIFTRLLMRLGRTVKIVLVGPGRHSIPENPTATGVTGCLPYRQYLQHLRWQPFVSQCLDTQDARMEVDYLDNLQRPLQPLADHLEYEIYENFERDPVKYVKYQEAIRMALEDLLNHLRQEPVTVYVVGAGRGPLVTAVMNAMEKVVGGQAGNHISIVVVEKNPSAVTILKSRCLVDPQWQQYRTSLRIVESDLRDLTLELCGGKYADIVVSELLGSFGDNELSPECLDSFYASPVCRKETVSIPTRYTSYLSLANSAKLYTQAKQQSLYPNEQDSGMLGLLKAMETPYVVRTHACSQMGKEQECWTFEHPFSSENVVHQRDIVLDFAPSTESVCGYGCGYGRKDEQLNIAVPASNTGLPWTCTGLLGTFSADLYTGRNGQGTVQISIAPENFSVGMFSWFPLYFPISEPLMIPPDASVRVYLWRRQNLEQAKVWYEWAVAIHQGQMLLSATPIHNPGGRSYYVSMK